MTPPALQWRADGGYQSTSPPTPALAAPQLPPPPPQMFCYPPQQMYLPPPGLGFVSGPVGLNGLFLPAPPNININFRAPLARVTVPPPPPPPPESKGEDEKKKKKLPPAKEGLKKKEEVKKKEAAKKKDGPKKKDEPKKKDGPEKNDDGDDGEKESKELVKKKNPSVPPPLLPGSNNMFPQELTKVHIFFKSSRIWERPQDNGTLRFKMFDVDTQKTVRAVIEHVRGVKKSEEAVELCGGWAATEVYEMGDGSWIKGSTIEHASDKAQAVLASLGWTARRGASLPPVWLVVHRV